MEIETGGVYSPHSQEVGWEKGNENEKFPPVLFCFSCSITLLMRCRTVGKKRNG